MSRHRLKTHVLVALLASNATALASATPCAAAPPPAADASAAAITEAARARFSEAVRFYAKKKYSQALASFLQAYALTKRPAILFNIGQTMLRAGHPIHAARYFQKYLRDAGDATTADKARAVQGLAEARQELGLIEVTAPDGSEISVDGEAAGRAPLAEPVDVVPGSHEVKITTPSGPRSETVSVAEGQRATVKLAAARALRNPEPFEAPVDAPAPSLESTAAPGFFDPPATIEPVYFAGGIGLASLTAAIILSGIRSNADRNGEIATIAASIRTAKRTLDETSGPFIGTLAVGAGATAFALGWYFFAPKAGAPTLAPVVGSNMTGASLQGTF